MDSKTDFGYDFAEIFLFMKIENVYINTFTGKTLDIPYLGQATDFGHIHLPCDM